ncbi:MAG: DMT family transporter [Halolamina sp.]|uniref:DMT family transporter n=1 Tax=Halolamina sp. TaxID=1940283 RepID=UPI002FC2ECE1
MSRYRNLVFFLLLAAVWGSAFMAIKAGLAYFPPVLFAAVLVSLNPVLTRWLDAEMPIESMETRSMLGGAGLMHAVSSGLGESVADVTLTPVAVASMAYLAIAASAAGFLVYFDLLDRLGPIEINMVSYVAPVFAALSGWLFLEEAIRATTVTGFLLIVAGFSLLKRRAIAEELGDGEGPERLGA